MPEDVRFTSTPSGHDSWTRTYNQPALYEWFSRTQVIGLRTSYGLCKPGDRVISAAVTRCPVRSPVFLTDQEKACSGVKEPGARLPCRL